MKLFNSEDKFYLNYSLEQFNQYFNVTNVIAQEALSDYLYKIKDKFVNSHKFITNQISDKIVQDTLSNKFEMLNRIKRINFTNIREHVTSKPENFQGKYVDYTLDLINSTGVILDDAEKALSALKINISSYINDYDENKLNNLATHSLFKNSNKLLEAHTKSISTYFPINNGNTKAKFKDIFKTLNDIEALYKDIEILDKNINLSRLNYIAKLANECAELIDVLIEQNNSNKINLNNNSYKKDLIETIYIGAREVEFVSYLYSNAIYFYGSFKNNLEDLKKLSDM